MMAHGGDTRNCVILLTWLETRLGEHASLSIQRYNDFPNGVRGVSCFTFASNSRVIPDKQSADPKSILGMYYNFERR